MKILLISLFFISMAHAGVIVSSGSSPAGTIIAFAGQSCPTGYFSVDGSAKSRTTYPSLYSAIGTYYGSGDGSTTFNIPDLRGQFIRGQMPTSLNSIAGSGTVATNNATFTSHGINRTGFKVRLISGTITGLTTSTDYYVIVVDTNTLAFATTKANAIAGTKITISGTNSGVIAQYEDPDNASRFLGHQEDSIQGHWHNLTGSASVVSNSSSGPIVTNQTGSTTLSPYASNAITDGVSGTPRVATESRPRNVLVTYCIKY